MTLKDYMRASYYLARTNGGGHYSRTRGWSVRCHQSPDLTTASKPRIGTTRRYRPLKPKAESANERICSEKAGCRLRRETPSLRRSEKRVTCSLLKLHRAPNFGALPVPESTQTTHVGRQHSARLLHFSNPTESQVIIELRRKT